MLDAVKDFLHVAVGPTLYAGMWIISIVGAVRRAEWAFYLLIILIPLPTVWYRVQPFPMGHDILDLLVMGSFLGILFNRGGLQRAPSTGIIVTLLVVSYVALWNATLRYELPLPFSTDNRLLVQWKNYAEMIFLYFIAYNIARDEKQQKTVVAIMASVFLFIVARELRSFTAADSFSYDHRAEGPFWIVGLGSNHFGAFIADYGSLFLGLYFFDKHKYRKWIYLAAFLAGIYPLFYTYSRGAYLAILAAVVVFGFLKKPVLLVLVAALVFTWQAVLPPTVVERISMTEVDANNANELEASAAHRLILWEKAKQDFEEHPLFGVGYNAFGFTVPKGELTDTHNLYMKIASEQGVIGLAILAAILLRAIASAWSLYRGGSSGFYRGLGLGFLGCITAVCVSNIFGDRFSYFMLGSYFWIFWGFIDRARQLSREAPAADPSASPVEAPLRGLLATPPSPVSEGAARQSLGAPVSSRLPLDADVLWRGQRRT